MPDPRVASFVLSLLLLISLSNCQNSSAGHACSPQLLNALPNNCKGSFKSATRETFSEEVYVSELEDGRVLVHFHFTQAAPYRRHYTTFPKAVGQLSAAVPFDELSLSMTQGRWHYHRWGPPPLQIKPSGAELTAKFSPALSPSALPALWGNLSHALGGLFCASLNFVARPEATAPQAITLQDSNFAAAAAAAAGTLSQQCSSSRSSTAAEQQYGSSSSALLDSGAPHKPDVLNTSSSSSREDRCGVFLPAAAAQAVLYATLPQEASCTENLTPWLKLLPCRDAAGLGRLLRHRDAVLSAAYHSLQVHLHVQRNNLLQPISTTLSQSLALVLQHKQPTSSSSSSGSSSARKSPSTKPSKDVLHVLDLARLLGQKSSRKTGLAPCPIAQHTRVYLNPLVPGLKGLAQCSSRGLQGGSSSSDCSSSSNAQSDNTQHLGRARGVDSCSGNTNTNSRETLDAEAHQQQGHNGSSSSCQSQADMLLNQSCCFGSIKVLPAPAAVAVLSDGGLHCKLHCQSTSAAATQHMQQYDSCSSSMHPCLYVYEASSSRRATNTATKSAGHATDNNSTTVIHHHGGVPLTWKWSKAAAAAAAVALKSLQSADNDDVSNTTPMAAMQHRLRNKASTVLVSRYIKGTGSLHGGMVLQIQLPTGQAAAETNGAAAGAANSAAAAEATAETLPLQEADVTSEVGKPIGSSSASGAGSNISVCIFQVVPWQVRLWLHTLELCIDGKPSNLAAHLTHRHISLSQDRARPLVVHLCLALPSTTNSITLSAEYTKAFLTAFEHPPDAYRGFDVPAAQIVLGGSYSDRLGPGVAGACARWRVASYASDRDDNDSQVHCGDVPLLYALHKHPQQVYSPGLVVPLAVPDFSMPYNVICLTSTVLAVFLGASLNTLMLRPRQLQKQQYSGLEYAKKARRRKKLKLAIVLVVFGVLGLYLDSELQQTVLEYCSSMGLDVSAYLSQPH